MLNAQYISRMILAALALSSSHLVYGSSLPEKDEEKPIHSSGFSENHGEFLGLQDEFKFHFDAAQKGDAQAQFSLGNIYHRKSIEQNFEEAARYYKLSADQGHAQAQYELGEMYCSGKGVGGNLEEAVRYLKMCADQGHAQAQYALGEIYFKGVGVKENFEEAAKYYKMCADQGHAQAQYTLGEMYWTGIGVEKNLDQAGRYFKMSGDQGDEKAQALLEMIPILIRQKAGELLLGSKKNAQMMKDLSEIRATNVAQIEQNQIRTHMIYWINLKEMKGNKLLENGNKFRERNPQYAADCYLEASDAHYTPGKKNLEKIRKTSVYKLCFSCLESNAIYPAHKPVEYYVALGDHLEKMTTLEETSTIKTPPPLTTNQPAPEKKNHSAAATPPQKALSKNKKRRVNKRELPVNSALPKEPEPLFALGSHQPPQDKASDLQSLTPQGRSSFWKNTQKANPAPDNHIFLSDAPEPIVDGPIESTHLNRTPQEDLHFQATPAKKEKRTLRLKNPLKRKESYDMFKGETKEQKEMRIRERRTKKVLDEGVDVKEKRLTSSISQSFQDSQSHFSITESVFDEEESQVSQSIGPVDDVQARVKFFYPHLWRMIKKSPAQHLNELKIKNSNLIRSVLTILEAKKLLSGTVKRGNIHVSKMGDQSTVFVAHTTHGSGAHARWYQNPAVVVSFFTFVAKCDPDLRAYLVSKFGENCFARDMGGDDANGTTSPEQN